MVSTSSSVHVGQVESALCRVPSVQDRARTHWLDALTHALPIGSRVTISAAETLSNELGDFLFTGWSDGGARTHEIVVSPEVTTLTASYTS